MTHDEYVALLKEDEGFRPLVYKDSLGVATCGWGHALHVGSPVPEKVCEIFLAADLARVEKDYKTLAVDLDPVRAAVVRCMLFQMGLGGVKKFKRFLRAVRAGDFRAAAAHMLDSVWAVQTPKRAWRLAGMMLTGIYGESR
jgi:lysozyme